MVVHLPEAALGVVLGRGHDEDVLDPLAMLGADIETVANHISLPFDPSTNLRIQALSIKTLDRIADTLGLKMHANTVPF